MDRISIRRIDTMDKVEWDRLCAESRAEDLRFLTRLEREYAIGENTSGEQGEALFGACLEDGTLIAVGGITKDSYSDIEETGRIRRFYVSADYRQYGVGARLLAEMIRYAESYYEWLVLFADTERASRFYMAHGFLESADYPFATHFMKI
ncbi:GNAT family N-acetyltransferase [Salibacterium aidingense]|uniref:GNAT family N-acetyltransferase n=1 Tax=Salibacterium aidingense TaxID=384933 RepID=UPI000420213B|nr:GNAT family N-acetyltransferase [Salibacterium aidingense]